MLGCRMVLQRERERKGDIKNRRKRETKEDVTSAVERL
jgi:hypothetical protein